MKQFKAFINWIEQLGVHRLSGSQSLYKAYNQYLLIIIVVWIIFVSVAIWHKVMFLAPFLISYIGVIGLCYFLNAKSYFGSSLLLICILTAVYVVINGVYFGSGYGYQLVLVAILSMYCLFDFSKRGMPQSLCFYGIVLMVFSFYFCIEEEVLVSLKPFLMSESIVFSEATRVSLKFACFLCTAIPIIYGINFYRRESQKLLHEKEVLIREVHHRVKNNLHMILALMDLQFKDNPDFNLASFKSKIKSIALTHQYLYSSSSDGQVELSSYMQALVESINEVFKYENQQIHYHLDDRVKVDFDHSIPLGLIVAELVTNCFKHGLQNRKTGALYINLSQKKEVISLIIRDNGPGLDGGEVPRKESFGLYLVDMMAAQINGKFSMNYENGMVSTLLFSERRG